MKLRTFRVLYYLCVLCTFVLSEEIDWENQSISKSSRSSNTQETGATLNANIPRDKRALGLILSGLAQVFGYTVNPVQIATLPNSNSEDEARATQSSANSSGQPSSSSNSTRSNGSSTTVAPKQRETIRFTGVLNFGNSTGLLGHLQQYESIFHEQNGSSNSTTNQPPAMPYSMTPPQLDLRTPISNQSMLPPLVVKIPLPAIEEPPLRLMPKLPLPEIPPQDIQLSYPEPFIPVRMEQQTMYRKNVSREKMTVESKQINNGKEVQSSPLPTEEPRWKKEHEERLSELERKQQEQADKLRQQEWYRNRQKDENYSGEKYRNGYDKEERNYGSKNTPCRNKEKENFKNDESSEEEDHRSKERYESGERNQEYPTSQKTTKSQQENDEDGEKEEKYRDYKQYQDTPEISENYTSIQYSEPLPLSEDDEQRRPEELRNSYGELLGNRELFDEGFLNYFSKFKEPLSDFYSSIAPPSSKEETSKEAEDSRGEDEDRSREKITEVDDVPARNKYEEYSLEEDTNTRRQDEKGSNEDTSEPSLKYSNNVSSNGENRSYFEERKTIEEMDFNKYMPFVVPVRYLDAPEELKKVKSRFSATEKSPKAEATKRVSVKESYRPKKENSKGIRGPLERHMPKKLHEGEQKELQVWPPPFDFVVDSTIHTNVVPAKSSNSNNVKVSIIREKPESSGKRNKRVRQQRGRRVTSDNSTQSSHDTSENIVHQKLKNNSKDGKVSEKRLMFDRPVNAKRADETPIKVEEIVQDDRGKKEQPDFWKRYKYTLYNNYRNTEPPNVEVQHYVQRQTPDLLDTRKLEISKPTEKTEVTVENYYTELYPEENKNPKIQDGRVVQEKSESMSTFDPMKSYNFFDYDENPYGFNYGAGNERLPDVFEESRKIENERAIGITMPRQDVYRYDESLTKFASEPERRNEKVGGRDYGNAATTMRIMKQEWISPNRPISYVDYTRVL